MRIFILLFTIVSLVCCFKDEDNEIVKDEHGIIIKKPYLWKTNLCYSELSLNDFGIISPPILYNKYILMGGEYNDQPFVWFIDTNDGEPVWNHNMEAITDGIRFSYQYYNYIILIGNSGHIYNFDLNTQSVIWHSNIMTEFRIFISGIDSLFFSYGYKIETSNPIQIISGWSGNIFTGELIEFYTPDMNPIDSNNIPVNGIGGVDRIIPFFSEINEIMLIIFVSKQTADYSGDELYFGLYNYSKNQWVYNKKKLSYLPEAIMGIPTIINQKLYLTTTSDVYCIDIWTGSITWKTMYNNYFSSEGHVIADGKIIALMDGYSKDLVCHDLYTGAQIWRVKAEGTSSTLEYLNGVVYFASMGDGRIHAVDAATGKYLWRLKPPDDSGLKYECAVVPGENGQKGRVIVSTFLNGYCYEAER